MRISRQALQKRPFSSPTFFDFSENWHNESFRQKKLTYSFWNIENVNGKYQTESFIKPRNVKNRKDCPRPKQSILRSYIEWRFLLLLLYANKSKTFFLLCLGLESVIKRHKIINCHKIKSIIKSILIRQKTIKYDKISNFTVDINFHSMLAANEWRLDRYCKTIRGSSSWLPHTKITFGTFSLINNYDFKFIAFRNTDINGDIFNPYFTFLFFWLQWSIIVECIYKNILPHA
jgi:hypothetical protein